jgi:hypothetical protein
MKPRIFNALMCFAGIFLVWLSFAGMAAAISSASTIGGATHKSPEALPIIRKMEERSRQQWFLCRIAGGGIITLSVFLDLSLSRKSEKPNPRA